MKTAKPPLSNLLQRMVDAKSISIEVAERLSALRSQRLQLQALQALPAAFLSAADALCARLEHPEQQTPPERTVLYDSRAPESYQKSGTEDLVQAVGEDLPGVLKGWARQLWQSGKIPAIVVLAVALWAVPAIWRSAVWIATAPYRLAKYMERELPSSTLRAPNSALPLLLPDPVDPLPMTPVQKPAPQPVRRPAVPSALPPSSAGPLVPPRVVHVEVHTPDLIYLTWSEVSKDARYNVYSSGSRLLSNLSKENEQPIKTTRVAWTPETGRDRYWIVVTTLDAEGKESAYSEAVEVIRHPEKPAP